VYVCFLASAVWLKGKGDDFYRAGDFASAISAYSAALDLDTSNSACLSNRSACFLHVRRLEECVADCARALALIPVEPQTGPTPPRSVTQRIKLFARQGTALCQLGRYSDALTAFQSAGALEKLDSTFAITAGQVSKLADRTHMLRRSCDAQRWRSE
jgi:Flp pilus assembly protein TadD